MSNDSKCYNKKLNACLGGILIGNIFYFVRFNFEYENELNFGDTFGYK